MTGDHLIGRTLDGRYRLESLIARGGMATVYAAHDLRLRRTVAVKVMHASLAEDPGFVHRFEREAHAAAQLANPHVVAVHDQGRDDATGAIYLVMEYVIGRTVREILAARGALTEVQALAVLDPVLQALAAAHDAGFVHRDVKPENVIVGDDGRIKVTDFGLARAIVSSPLSAATQGVLIGTVAYLSPEQVERGHADARSDVYGAGVLLYEMLTGEVPHSGETPLAVAYQHVHTDVPAPSQRKPGLSPAVDAIVARATRRDAEARFSDAREFLAEIRATRARLDANYTPMPLPTSETTSVDVAVAQHTVRVRNSDPGKPATPPRQRRSRRLLLPMLLIAAAGASGAWWWLTVGSHSTVPAIVGVPVAEAQQLLQQADLKPSIEQAWSKRVPEGSVIDAQPTPGMTVVHGTAVQLIVSKGPERYAVPDVVGETADRARSTLAAVKLTLGDVTSAYSESVKPGIILRSSPSSGRIAQPGDRVDVVVSKGPAPIAVPSVARQSVNTARSALESLSFVVTSATQYDDTVPNGDVIRSEPGSGALLQRGSRVKLVVSKGPAPVRVPDVFKFSQSRAESTLRAAGLQVLVKKASGRLLNLVKEQSPAAGSLVPRGSTVTISIV